MFWLVASSLAATLSVGPSGTYPTPCAAIAAAAAGDVIEVDAAGDYAGDSCAWSTDRLTVRGVNGQALMDGTGADMAQQKGIFVIQAPTATIENMAFVGASVPDNNGAGIRHQGADLFVTDCLFRDNQNGILGAPSEAWKGGVYISRSEFDHNGAGDGYSHNLYLGNYEIVSMEGSYSHRGNVGHLFKSRAATTWINASRFTDEEGGAASYEIDLPDAGSAWIVGSFVEQVSTTQNNAMIAYGEESLNAGETDLHIVNSTLLNHHDRGTFISPGTAVTTPVAVTNTLFVGPGEPSAQSFTTFTTSWTHEDGHPSLVDVSGMDVHLDSDSPCIDAGSDPAEGAPTAEFVSPVGTIPRIKMGDAWDIGAYEFGNTGVAAEPEDTAGEPPVEEESECECATGASPGWSFVAAIAVLAIRRLPTPPRRG